MSHPEDEDFDFTDQDLQLENEGLHAELSAWHAIGRRIRDGWRPALSTTSPTGYGWVVRVPNPDDLCLLETRLEPMNQVEINLIYRSDPGGNPNDGS